MAMADAGYFHPGEVVPERHLQLRRRWSPVRVDRCAWHRFPRFRLHVHRGGCGGTRWPR